MKQLSLWVRNYLINYHQKPLIYNEKRLLSLIAGASLSFTLFAQGNFATKDHGFVHGVSKTTNGLPILRF